MGPQEGAGEEDGVHHQKGVELEVVAEEVELVMER